MSVYYDSSKYTVNDNTYSSSSTPPSGPVDGPQTVNASGPYSYLGCYSEGSNGRALADRAVAAPNGGGSIDYCESQCAAGGFQYFGVEYVSPKSESFLADILTKSS